MNALAPDLAVITGVGPGLGASLARKFANEGCRVALLARSFDYLETLSRKLRENGAQTLAIPTDLGDVGQIATAFDQIRTELGPVDILINNASASGPFGQSLIQIDPESFTRGWRVGVLGALLCSQAVVPDMLSKGAGSILFTGATSSIRGAAITFSSAKFGLRGLVQAMARELWPKGIHVAHVVIDGVIADQESEGNVEDPAGEPLMRPAAIAEAYWGLVKQDRSAWTLELDLRPNRERFYE